MFGSAPVRQIVRTHAEKSAANILDAIMRELEAFRGPQGKMEDDATLVVVKVT